ncbi:MAG: hypothetical protein JWM51_178 [Microbacteriaceae bacterium]|jgi:hypothetical protein|nr:hypothetical protein [Microbacteriaceae bacterium]
MQPPPYEETRAHPLVTDTDIENRVAALVGRAQQREIWLLFLDENDIQLPVVLPFSDPPVIPPDDDLAAWSAVITEVAEITEARSVIVVIERYGTPTFGAADRAWARFLANGCGDAAIPLRAVVLSHRRGVRAIPPDDYVG